METSTGSEFNQIVGVGERQDPRTGRFSKVTTFYPSHFKEVLAIFELYPVQKTFGISIRDAMNLPVDQWYDIRKAAERIGPEKPNDSDSIYLDIIQKLLTPGDPGS